MSDLVADLRLALRRGPPDAEWRPLYANAMQAAYASGDFESVRLLAASAAAYLDIEGRQREAFAEIEFGLTLASGDPSQRASMLRVRAWYELMAGKPDAARASLSLASPTSDASEEVRLDHAFRSEIVEAIHLGTRSGERLPDLISQSDHVSLEGLSAFGKLWLIVSLGAAGSIDAAMPWIDALEAHGAAYSHRWRVAEAAELRRGCRSVREPAAPCDHDDAPDPGGRGYIAEWLHAGRAAYDASRLARSETLDETPAWAWARSHMPEGYSAAGDGFRAAVEARFEGRCGPVQRPPVLTLLSAGSALAAAEAVATVGTQAAAAEWSLWFARVWPAWMQTSIEWPASALRVRGLLLARAGNIQGAITMLRRAEHWCADARYAFEHATTLVQLAELLALAPGAVRRRTWVAMRSTGRLEARRLGLDVPALADAAASAATQGKFDAGRSQLTPREVEVLQLFRNGLTYRDVGNSLRLDWRTVQTHAKNIYAKLEVNSKTGAVTKATELGLL